jgi:hypothetical protein
MLLASAGFAAADSQAANEIRDAVAASEFPFMRDVVKPFFERSTATTALIKLGKARGYGAEWSRDTEEWRQAEAVLQAAAPKRALTGEKLPWPDCLEQLSAEELHAFARAVKSPEWREALRQMDLVTAIFGMLSVKDAALFPERDRIVEQAQRDGASMKEPVLQTMREKLGGANLRNCFSVAFLDINRRHMPLVPGEVPDAARIAAPYLERFDARNPQFRGEWLLRAVNAGDLARVSQLLDRGADIDGLAKPPFAGPLVNPLYVAARSRTPNQRAMVELLVARGANVNARTANGQTALYGAVIYGDLDTVKYLIDRGADVLVRSSPDSRLEYIVPADSPTGRFLREKVREEERKRAREGSERS